jgi:hypothetical protein
MPDAPSEYVFLAATAAIAIGWGLVLVRRLPKTPDLAPLARQEIA